jgi:hypothetical protein
VKDCWWWMASGCRCRAATNVWAVVSNSRKVVLTEDGLQKAPRTADASRRSYSLPIPPIAFVRMGGKPLMASVNADRRPDDHGRCCCTSRYLCHLGWCPNPWARVRPYIAAEKVSHPSGRTRGCPGSWEAAKKKWKRFEVVMRNPSFGHRWVFSASVYASRQCSYSAH